MPLPSPDQPRGTSNPRSRRTPTADSNAAAGGSPATDPALVACTPTVPSVIKLDCVATDMMGKSGRAMLDALVSGNHRSGRARRPRGQLRKKIPALREASVGRFDTHHALVIGAILTHIDFLDEQVERLSAAIEETIRPFAAAVELLCTIPGAGRRTAEVIVAETGVDMTVSRQPSTSPRGPGCARATTSPLASAARARPARAPSG